MVINKTAKFSLKVAKNIAKLSTEEERKEALDAVQPESRHLIEVTVRAILRNLGNDHNSCKPEA